MDDIWRNVNNSPSAPRPHPGVSSIGQVHTTDLDRIQLQLGQPIRVPRHLPVSMCLLHLVCIAAAAASGWRISVSVLGLRVKGNPNLTLKSKWFRFHENSGRCPGLWSWFAVFQRRDWPSVCTCLLFPHSEATKPVGKLQRLPSWALPWQPYGSDLSDLLSEVGSVPEYIFWTLPLNGTWPECPYDLQLTQNPK